MTPAKGRKAPSGADVKALLTPLAVAAANALRNPDTRRRIAEHGKALANSATKWRDERAKVKADRAVSAETADEGKEPADRPWDRVGQRGLERRAKRARRTIQQLTSDDVELASNLEPVVRMLDGLDKSLVVAAGLPLVKRTKAHRSIDDVLDDIEEGLFDATRAGGSVSEPHDTPPS